MSSAHERKKEPEQVRRKLLDCAAQISVERGLASVTIQAVAEAAGVTKGGLLHHFPGKRELIEAVFSDLLGKFDAWIDALMAKDPVPYGRFTRAYAATAFLPAPEDFAASWTAIGVSVLCEPTLKRRWDAWYERRLERHRKTDSALALEVVRLASDGVWLAHILDQSNSQKRPKLHALIQSMTKKK